MSNPFTPAQTVLVQCTFCFHPNFLTTVNDGGQLCTNCKLDLSRLGAGQARNEPAVAAPTSLLERATESAPEGTEGKEPFSDTDPIELLFAAEHDEAEAALPLARKIGPPPANSPRTHEQSAPAPILAEPAPRARKRGSRKLWIMAGAMGALVACAGVATALIVSSPTDATTATSAVQKINVAGWEATPAWTIDVAAEAAAERHDGATLLLATPGEATIVDATTGDTITTQTLTGDTTPRLYWAGDTAVVIDGDTLFLWGDVATPEVDGEDATPGDTTSWEKVELGDASLSLRGDMIFVVTEVGSSYETLSADATRTDVAVPTTGAVPVSATGDTITWGTNKGVAYVTNADGGDSRDITLTPPSDTAKVSRWISGDTDHVYVVWSDGDTDTLAVHSLDDGDSVSSHPLTADRDTSATSTRDGAHVAYAGLLIDATTGAITETSRDIVAAIGDQFLSNNPDTLITPDGDTTQLKGDKVTPISIGPDGELIVRHGNSVASLPVVPAGKSGARQP